MTEMEIARRLIIELRQTGRVLGYIQRFCTLRYKIPSMMEDEAHLLLLHKSNARLTCTISRQQREVLRWGKNKRLLKKEIKKAGGERILGLLFLPGDQYYA